MASLETRLALFAARVAGEFNARRPAALTIANSATDFTTNLNQVVPIEVPFSAQQLTIGAGLIKVGSAIRTDYDGNVRLTASVYGRSLSGSRTAIQCRFRQNGVALPPIYNTSYVRRASGHNEASCACTSYIVPCASGDLFTLQSLRDASTPAFNMFLAGSSYLMAEKVI